MKTHTTTRLLSLLGLSAIWLVMPLAAQDDLAAQADSPFADGEAGEPVSGDEYDPFGPSPAFGVTELRQDRRRADAQQRSPQHLAELARGTMDQLKTEYGRTKNKAQRTGLEQKMRNVLTKYFELDMEKRQEELQLVKQRVKRLEELLEYRADSKESLIKAQLDTAIREAQGLGFFRLEAASLAIPGDSGLSSLGVNTDLSITRGR